MIRLDDKAIIPIGCSCINQFQIEFYFGKERCSGLPFQWTIATPRTSVEILEAASRGALADLFFDRSDFEMDGDHMRNRHFEGFYHWHEDAAAVLDREAEDFERFTRKMAYLGENMCAVDGPVWLLWSNLQPNLRQEIEDNTRLDWSDFRLTQMRRDEFARLPGQSIGIRASSLSDARRISMRSCGTKARSC